MLIRPGRILLLALDFAPGTGGIQTYLSEIFGRLARTWLVVVVAPEHPGSRAVDLEGSLRLRRAAAFLRFPVPPGLARGLSVLRVAAGEVRRMTPDVVVAAHPRLAPGAVLLGRAIGRPVISLTYGMELTAGRGLGLVHAGLRHSTRVVHISRYSRDVLVRCGVDPARLVRIWPGVDPDTFREAGTTGGDRDPAAPVLLTVARLDARETYKGHDVVLEALPLLLARFPGLRYRIVGDGTDRDRLERLARSRGIGTAVEFAGRLGEAELREAYRQADVFVMPSRVVRDEDGEKFEGFGIAFLEAAAAGVPVVAGRSGGIPDAVLDGRTGCLVDPTDPAAVAGAVGRLLENPAWARAMVERARERLERSFTWDRAAAEMGTLLEALRLPRRG